MMIKKHKSEVLEILFALGVAPINAFTIPVFLVDLLSQIGESAEIMDFLSSQGQNSEESNFGSVIAFTEENPPTS